MTVAVGRLQFSIRMTPAYPRQPRKPAQPDNSLAGSYRQTQQHDQAFADRERWTNSILERTVRFF
jgi:hypothetical protein